MKLALGTVQFGLNYGVANTIGQVDKNEVKKILTFAKREGIDTLDTAIGYGDSEKYLGHAGINDWNVITKLPEVGVEHSDINFWTNDQISNSLLHLNVSSVYGVLLHRPLELLEKNGLQLWKSLKDLKERGIVKKIGFSIYRPSDLDSLWKAGFLPDIVQAPYNVFDQRLKKTGWLDKLNESKVEVHTRSVFLQGLLLMAVKKRPKYFNRWNNVLEEWDFWLESNKISGLEAALNFSLSENLIDKVIVGIGSKAQLSEIISSSKSGSLSIPEIFSSEDEDLINPSLWDL
jgi:aryl-alcohol dehydrogenase-like predicted oxidoreductase